MTIYQRETVLFEPPDAWVDRTIVIFAASPARIEMTREPLAEGEALEAYAERKRDEIVQEIGGVHQTRSAEILVGGRRALRWLLAWRKRRIVMEQHLVMVAPPEDDDRAITLFSATAPTDADNLEEMREAFDRMLAGVRFRPRLPPPP